MSMLRDMLPLMNTAPCPECEGEGHVEQRDRNYGMPHPCERCAGTGWVARRIIEADRLPFRTWRDWVRLVVSLLVVSVVFVAVFPVVVFGVTLAMAFGFFVGPFILGGWLLLGRTPRHG